MDLSFTPEQDGFRQRLREWLAKALPAGWAAGKMQAFDSYAEQVAFLTDWQKKVHAGGWCGLSWPKEYGGAGASVIEQAIYNEEMARAQAPELINKVGINNVGPTLMLHGSEEQRRRFLPKILSADEIWCQLFSEPGAGSDLAGLHTRAERDGDGYRLTGQKVWTSYAEFSRFAICLARTDPSLPKHKGITYMIVDMQSPGIDIRPLRQMTGDAEFNEVFLDAVYVPPEYVIGGENNGWAVAMNTLAHERGTNYLFKEQVNNKIAVERMLEQLRSAMRDGKPVHPALRQRVVDNYIRVEIMRLLNLDTMTRLDRGQEAGPETSWKKEFWTRLAQDLHETALAMQGAQGQLMPGDPRAVDHGHWQRWFLYSRSWSISGGTSEVQLNIVASRLLGLPRG
jgi:alkylation response protein AidB-like acyl-CoA dehydrogenase